MNIGSSQSYFPNRHYICEDCGRDLGDTYSRLKGKKQPNINKLIDGTILCDKCMDKRIGNRKE